MKRFTKLFFLLAFSASLFAQSEMVIEPGTSDDPVFINEYIHGDTTETGERTDPSRVYVLKRDGLYFVGQEINIGDNLLHIKAEDGDGFPPFIAPYPREDGSYPRMFRPAGNTILEGIHWNNINGESYKWGGNASTGKHIRVELRDCFIERENGAGWMTWGDSSVFVIENCVIGNLGSPKRLGGNGRAFDSRGKYVDSLIIRNSTIYLISDRIVRNLGGEMKYFEFDHNTVIHTQGRHGGFTLGKTKNVIITNNVLANPLYMGNHPGTEEQTHPDAENFYVIAMDTVYEDMTLEIRNNNIYYDQAVLDYYSTNDSVSKPEILEPLIVAELDDAASDAYFSEPLVFENVPAFPMDYLVSIFADPNAEEHPDNFATEIGITQVDAKYDNTTTSFTADDDGKPVGSHQWWSESDFTGIFDNVFRNPLKLQVYPNPSKHALNLRYEVTQHSNIDIEVYNIIGERVLSTHEGTKTKGVYQKTISVETLPAGTYFLKVKESNKNASVQKVLITK